MELIKYFIGILLLLIAGAISFWGWVKFINRNYLGWFAVPVVLLMMGLTMLGTHFTVGVSLLDTPLLNFFIFYVIIVTLPLFILVGWFLLTTKPVIISKPLKGGKIKLYIYAILQVLLMGLILWLIWITCSIGHKHYFG